MHSPTEKSSEEIKELTEVQFLNWVISKNFRIENSMMRSENMVKSYDSIILSEDERVSRNQRLLLECEKPRVRQDRAKKTIEKTVLDGICKLTKKKTKEILLMRINSLGIDELLNGKSSLFSFISFAYGEGMNFNKIMSLCEESEDLTKSIIDLVSDHSFCLQTNKKARTVKDLKTAIGIVGVDNCKMIMPAFIIKSIFNFNDKNTLKVVIKLWEESVLSANTSRIMFEDNNVRDPSVAILMGFLVSIGRFIIVDNFTKCHDEAAKITLDLFKKEKLIEEVFSVQDFPVSLHLLSEVIEKEEKELTKRVVKSLPWNSRTFSIRDALMEDLDNVPYDDRDHIGKILVKSKAISILEIMSKENAFIHIDKIFWLEANNLEQKEYDQVIKKNPWKFKF